MFYLTGDTHGDLYRVVSFCTDNNLTKDDTVIILGDVGLNYYGNTRDLFQKELISKTAPTIFCVHGNHEMNPEYMKNMKEKEWHKGVVFYEEKFPHLLYAKDGEIYDFDGKTAVVLGGAYSVDKDYRLSHHWNWFSDEQMSDEVKARCISSLEKNNWQVDYVLSHTVPINYMPTDMFLSCVDQSTVDKSMEEWLQNIHDKLTYKHWYAGHYHCSRTVDNVSIMFEDWKNLD